MKRVIIFLIAGSVNVANAFAIPTGDFDCSRKKGSLHVSITNAGKGIFLEFHHTMGSEETVLQGNALLGSHKFADGTVLNRVSLPGSSVELYFDVRGNLGLDRNSLDCRKL